MTRDGTFYVEDGEIKYAIKNFRFNESPVIMLNNIEALGKPVRANGCLIPPMVVRDFTFSQFVGRGVTAGGLTLGGGLSML